MLLLLFYYLPVALCKKFGSEGTYFTHNNEIVFKDEVILEVPHISLVQCLLQCKSHIACHDVAMGADQQCLLLRDDIPLVRKFGQTVNATRFTSIVSHPNQIEQLNNTSINNTTGKKVKCKRNICVIHISKFEFIWLT